MNLWIDRKVQGQIKKAIETTIINEEPHLRWTGEGYYFALRLFESTTTTRR